MYISQEVWENTGGIIVILVLVFLLFPIMWWLGGEVVNAWIRIGCDLGLLKPEICLNHICDMSC